MALAGPCWLIFAHLGAHLGSSRRFLGCSRPQNGPQEVSKISPHMSSKDGPDVYQFLNALWGHSGVPKRRYAGDRSVERVTSSSIMRGMPRFSQTCSIGKECSISQTITHWLCQWSPRVHRSFAELGLCVVACVKP